MAESHESRADLDANNVVPDETLNDTTAADSAFEAATEHDETATPVDMDDATVPAASAEPELTEEERRAQEAEAQLLVLFQSTVFGPNDEKIGRVGQVYLDDQTQEPNWVTVKTGIFGTKEYFVPLDLAERSERQIRVPYDKATVTSAPLTEIDQNLSPEEEDELYAYYQVPGRTADMAPADAAAPALDNTEATPIDVAGDVDNATALNDPAAPIDEPMPTGDANDSGSYTGADASAADNAEAAATDAPDDAAFAPTTEEPQHPIGYSPFADEATEDAPVEMPQELLDADSDTPGSEFDRKA
ncbi:PRC-barrel domain-containing protein [Gulosibacter bifidus]|uniref:PRC-barrel domain-containing protein n=1 Tax=Gulosibacter bifidus TaxID=272239 RepID=A0ABW5RH12_9MICO|nr:PRC-barrel domain-containing protein [Gulosibacter bifidus]